MAKSPRPLGIGEMSAQRHGPVVCESIEFVGASLGIAIVIGVC